MDRSRAADRLSAPSALRINRSSSGLLLLVVMALLAIGCASGSTAEPATTAEQVSTPPTSATVDQATSTTVDVEPAAQSGPTESPAEAEVIGRYIAYWDARRAANTGVPDPAAPALRDLATGPQLDVVIEETQHNLDAGVAFQDRSNPAAIQTVRVIKIEGERAQVQECVVDDEVVIRRDTGVVVDDTVATHSVLGELELVDGEWRVSTVRLVQRWEGVDGCALAS